ncbi:PREDICTED: DNA-directed RNA polymerase subunit 5-like protein 1 [Camelina sativa]|uniref:DNA-directed RNA polymerase subunit 5-like protein 1 n=1 Tax=Camelina sativa TaxID=90675 RepID=A0ABM0V9M5_CAMSA|nr:PREDICTED: DNA-directed RNA polymerase subunit 5-like protein 1 [Camelina sativa]
MSDLDDEITRIFKVRRTVLQMLRDRGYTIEDSDLNLKREEFVQRFCKTTNNKVNKEALFVSANKGPNPADKIYVFYPEGPKVGVPIIKKEVALKMRDDKVPRGIIVVPMAITGPARLAVLELNKILTIEVFEEAELVTNITEHKLINKYYVLDDQAKKELLKKYTVQDTQLPRILITDPLARYYGLKRGQVVKIKRSDVTSLDYYTYRYAV